MTVNEDFLAPSPRRLVESLRDTGYSYQAAFADIVDNSVAASATEVAIDISEGLFGGDVSVGFFDNGIGMDEKALREAMRYGSEKRPSPKSLGKFGMGLKTASTAFCRRLTVISKQGENLVARCWDIDLIIDRDDWVLITPDLADYADEIEKLRNITGPNSGTAVIWENVDRLISASGRDYSSQALEALISEIRDHLAGTFGKFLIGRQVFREGNTGQPSPDVSITLNGRKIEGWDPTGQFLNSEEDPDRVLCQKKVHEVSTFDGSKMRKSKFELNGYVLPNKNKMTDKELSAVKFSNDNQGFYIYREDRLIFGGGWPHRLFSQDSHLNLLRVELNFSYDLDETFEIDIRKSKINLPVKIRDEFKRALAPWRNEAQRRYRRTKAKPVKLGTEHGAENPHKDSSQAIKRQHDKSPTIKVVSFDRDSSKIKIINSFGEVEINRAAVVAGTDIYVTTVSSIEGGMLWQIDMSEDERTVVVLNENHEFYRRFYLSTEVSPVLIQAMDSLFWALANAELRSISDLASRNFEELRFSLSESLTHLASELPDAE